MCENLEQPQSSTHMKNVFLPALDKTSSFVLSQQRTLEVGLVECLCFGLFLIIYLLELKYTQAALSNRASRVDYKHA